jgi:hypothetical protein
LGWKHFKTNIEMSQDTRRRLPKLNRKLDEYQSEIREIAATQQDPVDTRIQAAKVAHRSQARILKVLSEETSADDSFIPFVDLYEIAEESGLEYSVVSHHTRLLEHPDLGGYIRRDDLGEKAKVTSEDAYNSFCKSRRLNLETM